MEVKETNNGKKGGTLKGKKHYDKNGKPLGGIKAVVTDTKELVELEGGEVIINAEASAKHWKELDRINTSAGNGVHILPPDKVMADVDEYKKGGRIIPFNPNELPNQYLFEYAKNLKKNNPEIWQKNQSVYDNTAFDNLTIVMKRGYWLDSEKWFYYKWKSYCERNSNDVTGDAVISNLKWLNKTKGGWLSMKKQIEKLKKIDDFHSKQLSKGIEVEKEHEKTIEKIYNHEISKNEAPKHIAEDHLNEVEDYYDKLEKVENYENGGALSEKNGQIKIAEKPKKYEPKDYSNKYLNIEKVQKMENSDIFYNPEIFATNGDYIIGGFNVSDLNNIVDLDDASALTFSKLEMIFEARILAAIESFKNEVKLNVIDSGKPFTQESLNKTISENIYNLLFSYLGEEVVSYDSQRILEIVLEHPSYVIWKNRISDRVAEFNRRLTKSLETANLQNADAQITVNDAESYTYTSTLEEILEQLNIITEANEV